jgi:putative membrane protein
MQLLLNILLGWIAISHLMFLVLEMFLWTRPAGLRIFRMSPEKAQSSKVLAANQGLYNGFLAAGLLWGLWSQQFSVQLFFLCCVFLAGVYGAMTVSRRIFWVQGFPAMLGLLLLFRLY